MYEVHCTVQPAMIRLANGLPDIRGSILVSCSVPPSLIISMTIFMVCVPLSMGTPITFTPSPSAIRGPTTLQKDKFSEPGACPFGGKATVFPGLVVLSLSRSSCSRNDTTPTVLVVISAVRCRYHPEKQRLQHLKGRFSRGTASALATTACSTTPGPWRPPAATHWESRSYASRSNPFGKHGSCIPPLHLTLIGVSAGTQAAVFAGTAVRLTVLKTLGQPVRMVQFLVLWYTRESNDTFPPLSRNRIPTGLHSRLISSRNLLCGMIQTERDSFLCRQSDTSPPKQRDWIDIFPPNNPPPEVLDAGTKSLTAEASVDIGLTGARSVDQHYPHLIPRCRS